LPLPPASRGRSIRIIHEVSDCRIHDWIFRALILNSCDENMNYAPLFLAAGADFLL